LMVHTWSKDGAEILGVRYTENQRLQLVSFDTRHLQLSKRQVPPRELADLGPSIPVNNPVRGLTISGDGRMIATSMVSRLHGDLSLLEGRKPPAARSRWRELFRLP
jgi:hypothetical protein